ncbi:MAG: SIR2 family protein [Actinomycetota bacterium]
MLDTPIIEADDFARRFVLRSSNLMWLLGAGASAAAGVATAWDMIWDFKRQLFCSKRQVSPRAVEDLSNPAVRRQLQEFIDAQGIYPAPDTPEEYAALFEAVYPAEIDRRAYLDRKIAAARPSYGHLALATLMRAGSLPIVWTTNFDPLIADACAEVYGTTGPLTVVGLDAPDLADQAITAARFPVEIKIHGDFRSSRLKNTTEELREQDRRLRGTLVTACSRYGLVVAGYSGRDESVMKALEDALSSQTPLPSGLFWLQRSDPLPRVAQLLRRAVAVGVDAALVPIENFDETLSELVRLMPELDTTALERFSDQRRRRTPAKAPTGSRGWPVVRTNALAIVEHPTNCRLVDCQIGGTKEVREAIRICGVDVLAVRTGAGVLAFGSDADVRAALAGHGVTSFDLHTIAPHRTSERGLLRDALARALVRDRPLRLRRRRTEDLLIPDSPGDALFARVGSLVRGGMTGEIPGTDLRFLEAVAVRLEFFRERLWLLVEPRVVHGETEDRAQRASAASFLLERTARRYNQQWNELVDAWAHLLVGDGRLRALGIADGIDAAFTLSPTTAYSRRGRA